jgi:hypothetical protein
MNNGQVMLMDEFLSEEEQLLMAQGCYMEEDDEGRYYYDQDGNLAAWYDFITKPVKAVIKTADQALAKFDRAVIQPVGKAAVKGAISVIDLKVKSIGLSNALMKPAMALKTGQAPSFGDIGQIIGQVTGKSFSPGESIQSMVGGSPEMLEFLSKRTAVNVPAETPELIPQAKQIAEDTDALKNYIAAAAGVRGPGSLPNAYNGPGYATAQGSIQPRTGMDVGSILKNPIVLGVGGLVLLKVLKVF